MRSSTLAITLLALGISACGSESSPGNPAGSAGMGAVSGAGGGGGLGGSAGQAGGASVSQALEQDLLFLREEEKLARDVYLTLYDVWQLQPHSNIAASEQTHTDRVKDLLQKVGIPDPVVDDSVGVFVDPTLAKLYVDLVAQGKQSELAALQVGATIEDLDIRDIEIMKGRTQDPAALALYEALQCGSRNHMRTFYSQIQSRGASYAPQYISAAEMQAIVTGAKEKCN